VSRVGFVVHAGREAAVRAATELEDSLTAAGVETGELTDEPVGGSRGTSAELDLVVSVGGDGTLLRAARLAAQDACPIVGVKVGRMGFLTEVEPAEAAGLIHAFLEGRATVEERLAVLAELAEPGGPAAFEPQWALNEVIVEKLPRERLVRLAVHVDGTYVTTFSADGVIVATPTGSTAYSFSARGPIVTPSVDCLVLTPVAAHMVFDRSIVLDPSQHVTLEVVGEVRGVLSADGRKTLELPVGSRVRIGASPTPARLVRRDGAPSFLELVRGKFDLPGDPRVGAGG
jgi:NAD+ kinase